MPRRGLPDFLGYVAPPVEFSFTSPAFDVRSTTLPFPAAAIVCVTLTGAQAGDRLLRLEAGAWTEVTATVDVASSSVCGPVATLGIFATARLQPATVNVIERITVSDTPALLPSALVGVTEQILVAPGRKTGLGTDRDAAGGAGVVPYAGHDVRTDHRVVLPGAAGEPCGSERRAARRLISSDRRAAGT